MGTSGAGGALNIEQPLNKHRYRNQWGWGALNIEQSLNKHRYGNQWCWGALNIEQPLNKHRYRNQWGVGCYSQSHFTRKEDIPQARRSIVHVYFPLDAQLVMHLILTIAYDYKLTEMVPKCAPMKKPIAKLTPSQQNCHPTPMTCNSHI